MKPPEGYEQYTNDGRLLYCLLLKALYGGISSLVK